jgi:hypothetical protein
MEISIKNLITFYYFHQQCQEFLKCKKEKS